MRGGDLRSEALFSYLSCEARVPLDHPLRPIQKIVDEALGALTGEFEKLYAKLGRPSIPPGTLLRALLLQAFYSVRSERQLMEQGINPRLLLHGEDTVFDVLGHVGEIWDGEAADGKCVSHDFGVLWLRVANWHNDAPGRDAAATAAAKRIGAELRIRCRADLALGF
jgi:hypothetical protein